MARLTALILVVVMSWLPLREAAAQAPRPAAGGTIQEITVDGMQRIEPGTIRSYLLVQEGDAFDAARIDRSLKSLFATGLFADVVIQRQGNRLLVTVVENPVINRVAFEGNKKLEDDVLRAEIGLKPRVIYTRTKVQSDVKRILTLYRRSGRFAATVEPKVIQLPQNRVDLVFEVNEGDQTEIRNIRFVGNRAFKDSRLREVIRTKESRWWRFLTADDVYDPDRLTLDRELLRRFYLNRGYADFRVVSAVAELTPDRRDFFVTFTVDEGGVYKFGAIDIEARLRDLQPQGLLKKVEIEKGGTYSSDQIDQTVDLLSIEVGTLGYAFVDVRPRINRNRETRTIDVTFEINEGPRVFVERIDIIGNVRTLDRVIRREFKLVEGDAFNAAKLRRSRTRIQNLDYFEKVIVDRQPGSAPDKTVLRTEVQEKSTGSISIGAGFSTLHGPLGDVTLREKNFLGKGQDIRAGAKIAAKRSEVDFSFTEPYFMDREVAAGVDIFRVTQDNQDFASFDSKTTGGALRAGYPLSEDLRQSFKYTVKQQTVEDVKASASRFIREAEGTTFLSEISHSLLYDQRDSRVNPTKGYFVRMTNDLAGLGGVRYLRNSVRGSKYFPIAEQTVFSVSGTAAYIFGIGEDVRLLDRYFVGGEDFRGFETGGVGPRDLSTKDSLGSQWKYIGTTELTFPLGLPTELGVSGLLFMDVGSAGQVDAKGGNIGDSGSLRLTLGTGILWVSPVGPIGIDIGVALLKESFDQTELFRVNFGTKF
ncbi:MAG: outer membrane protein assembly factor BamA [Rhodospirillales bacterium]|nr:outer membrane protein assembly factor BamA [Rhodospirillales bacterium]